MYFLRDLKLVKNGWSVASNFLIAAFFCFDMIIILFPHYILNKSTYRFFFYKSIEIEINDLMLMYALIPVHYGF